MSDYSDYRVSQARYERMHNRAARQRRAVFGIGGVLLALLAMFAAASSLRGTPPPPPRIVLNWPSPEKFGKRVFSGTGREEVVHLGEVMLRRGQPFKVSLQNVSDWHATFVAGASPPQTTSFTWRPAADGETLKIFAQPVANGWRKLVAWTQRKVELRLIAREAHSLDANRRSLALPEGTTTRAVWLSQNVAAFGVGGKSGPTVTWDQRAIPLLERAAQAIPYRGPQPGPGRSMPLPPPKAPRWIVQQAFDNKPVPGDTGSYFALNAADALDDDVVITMTKLSRHIAARAPSANIKWIVKEPGSPDAWAALRLEFDGSGARGGWVKNIGETEASPLRWWSRNLGETEIRERLAPSLPR